MGNKAYAGLACLLLTQPLCHCLPQPSTNSHTNRKHKLNFEKPSTSHGLFWPKEPQEGPLGESVVSWRGADTIQARLTPGWGGTPIQSPRLPFRASPNSEVAPKDI